MMDKVYGKSQLEILHEILLERGLIEPAWNKKIDEMCYGKFSLKESLKLNPKLVVKV